ncbi:MAG TPA: type II toxin-antitoxin system RelE/ParE family toxin [Acidobacteriota bacterium]|nr:type II toxin-antitoxin system RelE/ParE family toxin [Acidobacteriota bacterium]
MKLSFTFDWLDQYEKLDPAVKRQFLAKLKEIDRIDSWPHEALKGKQFKGLYKLRVGNYRLIYRLIDGTTMDFLYLGHRREIYN